MTSAHSFSGAGSAGMALYLPPIAAIATAALAYAAGLRRLSLANRQAEPRPRHIAAFYTGLALLSLALLPPLDRLAEALFSAHMVQHLVVVLAASPLLVYGRPHLPFALAAPPSARRWINRGTKGARPLTAWVSGALAVGLLHAAVLWVWHLPRPYQAAIGDRSIHAVEHLSFFVTALLFWRLVIRAGGRRRLGHLPATLLVLATALQSSALGVILSFATFRLYPVHDETGAWGLTPLADQQLAGAIMWIPAGAVYLVTMVVLILRAFRDVEQRMHRAEEAVRQSHLEVAGPR